MFALHTALNSLSPIHPFSTTTFLLASLKSVPSHPTNVYPFLLGLFNVKLFVSTVYVSGLLFSNVASSIPVYVIL